MFILFGWMYDIKKVKMQIEIPINVVRYTNGILYGLCTFGYLILSFITDKNIIIYKSDANWNDKHIKIHIRPFRLFIKIKKIIVKEHPIIAWVINRFVGIFFLFVFKKKKGKNPSFAVIKIPLIGPIIHAFILASEPNNNKKLKNGTIKDILFLIKKIFKACITPDAKHISFLGTTNASDSDPNKYIRNINIADMITTFGIFFLGFLIDPVWNAINSIPDIPNNIPEKNTRLLKFNVGIKFFIINALLLSYDFIILTIPHSIIKINGIIVPNITPIELNKAETFNPLKFI